MATTGDPLYPSATTYPSSSTYPGQGLAPMSWILYSTDDVSDTDPLWVDATAKVRSFSTSRGRENELSEVDAGTAILTLDNRTRTFDPVINAGIRPMNRWKILSQFSGETQSIYVGYAESIDQGWDGFDAVATVTCADEFKVLALDKLPVTNPPRDTYADLVKSDLPLSYWRFHDFNNLGGDPGPAWVIPASGGYSITATESPIVGESEPDQGALFMAASGSVIETEASAFPSQSAAAMTVEFWFRFDALPGSPGAFFRGVMNAANTVRTFTFTLTTTGTIQFSAVNTAPTTFTATSAALNSDTWYHIAGTVGSSATTIYVNGAVSGSTSFSGTLIPNADDISVSEFPQIQSIGQGFWLDELAFYPNRDLGSARLAAHYIAGTQRGFPKEDADDRMNRALDAVSSPAPRNLQDGTTALMPTFMHGQSPLSELLSARSGESLDSMFFVTRDGTLKFLNAAHRASAPYNTIQATFDDDGTDLSYLSLDMDYSEAFLVNEWHVTPTGGTTATASDAASIAKYFKRSQSLTDLPLVDQADATTIADALLVKYKDPMTRILSLTLDTSVPAVAEAVLRLDLGDRIRVFRTPPGGGSRIDQTLFVQKISAEGANDGQPWRITLGVSPV